MKDKLPDLMTVLALIAFALFVIATVYVIGTSIEYIW